MENTQTTKTAKDWAIPVAIVIAGALIAGTIFWTRTDSQKDPNEADLGPVNKIVEEATKVKDNDHIRGDKNAPVKIIEYSDMECPFCKEFHYVLKKAFDEYDGKVAWVYRHFPIQERHPKALNEAIASECVAELGGNDKFWQFLDKFFDVSLSNNQTDLSVLPTIATSVGIDKDKFNECLGSGKYNEKINAEFQEALQTGGTGTPWSLLVTKDGRIFPINGYSDYNVLKQIIETALR